MNSLAVEEKRRVAEDAAIPCRFEDATNQCRPAKFLFDQETPAWHWWLSVQAAFHSGDLQKAHIHASMSMIPVSDGQI